MLTIRTMKFALSLSLGRRMNATHFWPTMMIDKVALVLVCGRRWDARWLRLLFAPLVYSIRVRWFREDFEGELRRDFIPTIRKLGKNWARKTSGKKKNNKERDKSFERHLESIFRCIKDKVYKTRFNPNYLKKPSEAQTGAIPKTTTFHFGCAKTGSRCELCLRDFPNSCRVFVFVCACCWMYACLVRVCVFGRLRFDSRAVLFLCTDFVGSCVNRLRLVV